MYINCPSSLSTVIQFHSSIDLAKTFKILKRLFKVQNIFNLFLFCWKFLDNKGEYCPKKFIKVSIEMKIKSELHLHMCTNFTSRGLSHVRFFSIACDTVSESRHPCTLESISYPL